MPSPSYFSILTADVRYDTGLSDFAKLLYSDITALCNRKGYCDATNDYFATQFGKSKRTISATVGALADAGYICIEVERDASNAVVARKIWVQANARAAAEKVQTPIEENFHRYREKLPDPMEENFYQYNRKNNTSKNNTPIVPKGDDGLFDEFWAAYPKHVAKQPARRAFDRLKPDRALLDKMLAALQWQTQSEQWTKDGARYVPNPATWLNARRWEDEPDGGPTPPKPSKPTKEERRYEHW